MGRGHHRDGLFRHVDTQLQAAGIDVGKVLLNKAQRLVRDVEVDAIEAAFFHLEVDGAGHHVARGQLGAFVVPRHEPLAGGQQQAPALAAHRFGNQEALGMRVEQAGRVKLDELHVLHAAAGPPGGCDAITGGGVGVGGVEVHLARATRGQNGVGRLEGEHLIGVVIQRIQTDAAVGPCRFGGAVELVGGDQVDQGVVLKQADVGAGLDPLNQGLLHGGAGGVGDMDDASRAVAALAGEVQLPGVAVLFGEGHAELLQPGDGLWRVFDDELGGIDIAQAGAGDQRVVHVGSKAVVLVPNRGYPPLCPAAAAFAHRALGEDGDPVLLR